MSQKELGQLTTLLLEYGLYKKKSNTRTRELQEATGILLKYLADDLE